MIWGHTGNEQSATGIASSVTSFVNKGYGFVLGFNEPDNTEPVEHPGRDGDLAVAVVQQPGDQDRNAGHRREREPGQAWFTSFMNMLNADTALRADFMAIHWYGWNAGSCNATASELESYIKWAEGFAGNRPIWITEWGCLNNSAPDVQTVVNFFNGAVDDVREAPARRALRLVPVVDQPRAGRFGRRADRAGHGVRRGARVQVTGRR